MSVSILTGDSLELLKTIPADSVHTCVTSPPYYGLRDYGVRGQIGIENTPAEFIARLVAVFEGVKRVLRRDGTLWVNMGDSYAAQRGGSAMPAETLAGGISGQGDEQTHRGRGDFHAHRNASAIGFKHKDLMGIPWRLAFALQDAGWFLRSDIIWHKPNPMPESVTDRPTKAHEYIFLLSKAGKYYYDGAAIEEPQSVDERARRLREQREGLSTEYNLRRDQAHGQEKPGRNGVARSVKARQELAQKGTRNKRTVWTVSTTGYDGAHFATFPPALIRPCILAGCPVGGTVLDPFGGSGTTGEVAEQEGRNSILIELNPDYVALAKNRTSQTGLFATPHA